MSKIKIAVDFGSVNTNIYLLGSGLVLSEPTVAALEEKGKGAVKFIGNDARKLIGKTAKNTKIVFPVFEGEIVNESVATEVLSSFLNKIGLYKGLSGITALFSVPCGADAQMVAKYKKVAKLAGISKIYFSESPVLSALGQGIPLNDATPYFIIDMAGGITNIAAVTLDGIIAGVSVNFGANKVTTDIIDYIAEKRGLQIGLLTAEKLKKEIGSLENGDTLSTFVNGRDIKTGTPKSVSLSAEDIFEPVKTYFDKIAEIALSVLKKLPPEVSAELRHTGLYISGVGSEIYALDKYYSEKFSMETHVASEPKYSVAMGGGIVLGNKDLLKKAILEYE